MTFTVPSLSAGRVSLLRDRLTARLPEGMVIAPRRASIMSAENASESEARGMLDVGSTRFVMMVYDLYELAGDDPHAAIAADHARSGHTGPLEPIALPAPLLAYGTAPSTITTNQDANLVYTAWIVSGDTTVQLAQFYVNPAGAADVAAAAAWSALGQAIVASLEPGSRALPSAAGYRSLDSLVVSVPDGWVLSAQPGPDFIVFRLRKLVRLGASGVGCSVYLGHHAAPQYEQQDAKVTPTRSTGTLLGAPIEWLTWRSSNGRWTTEALVRHPATAETVHVFGSTLDEAELAELRQVASTLRLAPAR